MGSTESEKLPKMEYRFLGRSGLQVSAISLGGWLTYGGHVENGIHTKSSLSCNGILMTGLREHVRLYESCL